MKNSTNFGGGQWVVDRNSFGHSLKCYMITRYTLLWSCGRNFLKTIIFGECHLAGRQYHDGNEVWEELKVGTLLELQRDQENPYDKNAVAVVYSKEIDNNKKEEYLLGYLPRTSNTEIAQLLEMGWTSIFECRISKINEDAHYENQIRLTIRIKQNQQAQNCVQS